MDNLYFYNMGKEVPETAKKPIKGGRMSGNTDINPMWRIKKLTEMFGPCGIGWYYIPVKKWMETYGEEVACFVDIELYIKVDGEWSKPIYGNGGNMFAVQEKSGIHISDECYKMATTDAISVACKQLGIGADVYWNNDRTKYTDQKKYEIPDQKKDEIPDKLKPVFHELKRIGYSVNSILKTYKIDSISNMSDLQIKDFLSKAKKLPDKE